MSLITFTTPFTGGPTFYTGNPGNSDLVPDIFPVAIAGRPYMLDMASGKYMRTFEARLRESQDQSDVPGEAAINPQGLWRRGQSSWQFGMDQKYGDLPTSNVERFDRSLGVDVWEQGELTLLNDVKVASSHTGANTDNIFVASVADEVWWTVNQTVYYTSNPFAASPTINTVTGGPAAKIRSIVSSGDDLYVVYVGTSSTTGIVKIPSSTHTISGTSVTHGVQFGAVGYAKGRLVAGGHDSSKLWFDPSGNNPSPDYTHPDANFRWVGFAAGQNAIYCAGYSGSKSLIYKVTIQSDGTLDTPVVAAELPYGEVVNSIVGYLGFVLIGTNIGLRYATADADASLVLGRNIPSPNPILCASGYDQYVWVGATNYTPEYTGLGRVDLARFVGVNEPVRAPDIMYEGQGDVLSVITFDSKRIFSVSGVGLIVEDADNLMEEGYVETGTWRWGIPDPKFLAFFDLEYETLDGTIDVEYAYDGGSYEPLGTAYAQGSVSATFTGPDDGFREARFKVTLHRDVSVTTEGPVLGRWQARAVPTPSRSELFQIPILLHSRQYIHNREYDVNVDAELEYLRDLIHSPRIVTFQEGPRTYKVIVEAVEWLPVDTPNNTYVFDGTATVTLRSLVE